MKNPPRGYVGLDVGQVTLHLNFPSFLAATFAFDYFYVEHLTQPNPLPIRAIPGARTTNAGGYVTGIDFTFAPAPDETGYVFQWGIA